MEPSHNARPGLLAKFVGLSCFASLLWLLTPVVFVFWSSIAILVLLPISLLGSLLASALSSPDIELAFGDVGQVLAPGLSLVATAWLFGAGLGAGQWLILRREVPRASLWIPASSIASALGSSILIIVPLHLLFQGGVVLDETVRQVVARLVVGGGSILGLSLIMFRDNGWWPKLALAPTIVAGLSNTALSLGAFSLPRSALAVLLPILAATFALPTGWLTTRWSGPGRRERIH